MTVIGRRLASASNIRTSVPGWSNSCSWPTALSRNERSAMRATFAGVVVSSTETSGFFARAPTTPFT
jgi:hypothetical protein